MIDRDAVGFTRCAPTCVPTRALGGILAGDNRLHIEVLERARLQRYQSLLVDLSRSHIVASSLWLNANLSSSCGVAPIRSIARRPESVRPSRRFSFLRRSIAIPLAIASIISGVGVVRSMFPVLCVR